MQRFVLLTECPCRLIFSIRFSSVVLGSRPVNQIYYKSHKWDSGDHSRSIRSEIDLLVPGKSYLRRSVCDECGSALPFVLCGDFIGKTTLLGKYVVNNDGFRFSILDFLLVREIPNYFRIECAANKRRGEAMSSERSKANDFLLLRNSVVQCVLDCVICKSYYLINLVFEKSKASHYIWIHASVQATHYFVPKLGRRTNSKNL